uniref:Uncharacterized protein n=1 Tax=Trichobilharzia regenti TaxID=157069 RepID=A0AA85JLF1_TRIRE|nr:unnamed protein product [Trichobilharzia regenti]
MSSQTTHRHRKQHFPRLERRKLGIQLLQTPTFQDYDSDDDPIYFTKYSRSLLISSPQKSSRSTKESKDTGCGRTDKRARDEHNEQERSRRRELAVIYELIRCNISSDDMHLLDQLSGPKSVDKLSYPQVLQIAYQLVLEEEHNLVLFERSLTDIKLIEKQLLRTGIPLPERPKCPPIIDNYRKIVQLVDDLLRQDKICRSIDGIYDVTPAERASIGDQEISYPTSNRISSDTVYSKRIRGPRSYNSKKCSSYHDNNHNSNHKNNNNYYFKSEETENCLSNWSNTPVNPCKVKRSFSSASLYDDDDGCDSDDNDNDGDDEEEEEVAAAVAFKVEKEEEDEEQEEEEENDTDSNLLSPSPTSIINDQNPCMWLDNYEFLDILTKIKEDPDYTIDNFDTTCDDEFSNVVDLENLIKNFKAEEPIY